MEKRRFLHSKNGVSRCIETAWTGYVKRRFFLLRAGFEPFGAMDKKLQFFPAALNGFLQGVYIVLPAKDFPFFSFLPVHSVLVFSGSSSASMSRKFSAWNVRHPFASMSWNIRLVETVFVSGECADGVADAAVLFGVVEADISVMHLPDEGAYPVGGDECVVPVHTIVLPDGGCLFHEPHPLKRMLFFNLGHCSSVYFDYEAKVGNGKGKDCPSLTHK